MTVLNDDIEAMDPTRSGSPLPTGNSASLSLNEIEQLCLKAARGAGMSWGQAEEAGFAAVWLARQGLDGPGALLAQLQAAQGRAWRDIRPVVDAGAFRAPEGGLLCPIALGSALCDYVALPVMQCDSLQIGPVTKPILLLPFLSDMARARQQPVRIEWPGGAVVASPDGRAAGDVGALATALPVEAELLIGSEFATRQPDSDPMAPMVVAAETIGALNTLAMRITVPASDVSRAGAGAAGDND